MHNEQTPSISELEKTVSRPVSFIGVGLHTGRKVAMQIKPAAAGTGIHFQRKDVGPFFSYGRPNTMSKRSRNERVARQFSASA